MTDLKPDLADDKIDLRELFAVLWREKWLIFSLCCVALLLASGLMFMLAGAFLPLVLPRPQKFCLFFTLGSMLSMASFAVLRVRRLVRVRIRAVRIGLTFRFILVDVARH